MIIGNNLYRKYTNQYSLGKYVYNINSIYIYPGQSKALYVINLIIIL